MYTLACFETTVVHILQPGHNKTPTPIGTAKLFTGNASKQTKSPVYEMLKTKQNHHYMKGKKVNNHQYIKRFGF